MRIELDIDGLKTRIESVLCEQRLIDDEEHIDIKSSNRYYNFWYGIAEVEGTNDMYGFSLNLDNEESPVVYRIFGNIKTLYGEMETEENEKNKESELIYEKLSPGDTLIISKQGDSFLVAENEDGEFHVRNIKVEEEDNGN